MKGERPARAIVRATIAALSVTLISSCALLSPPEVETRREILSKVPDDLPRRETHAATVLVLAPETRPAYDKRDMVYTTQAYQIAHFRDHEWAETPSQMLHPLIVRTLQDTRYFSAVLTPPEAGHYTYALRTEILELMQDFTSKPATVRLSLRLQLSDGGTNRIVAAKGISVSEPMQQETAYAGVVAANDATAKALQEMASFVLEKMP